MNSPLPLPVDPFSFDPPSSLLGRAAAYVARPLLQQLFATDALRRIYVAAQRGNEETFLERAVDTLSIAVDPAGLVHVPTAGPVIVAANHPRGALDGLVLATLVRKVRPDVRLLANYLLHRIPELREHCFFVDPFAGPSAIGRSRAGLRAAHLWLRRGGALVMFPAGEVAHRRDRQGRLMERPWGETLGRLALTTGATIVPAAIDGENSRLFHAAGRLHPALRTALLPRELLAAQRSRVSVAFRAPVIATGSARDVTNIARGATAAAAPSAMTGEIAALDADATLVQSGRYTVYYAAASEIPHTLQEIGRLRAITYREAGEGSGGDVDLDDFDRSYLHLFVWDREDRCVVGAYRIGRTDTLLASHGVDGLYTRRLFHYGPELIHALSPALELGRSFVRPEYQRNYQALLLLWRGVGAFVVRHPHYRVLFGPVSVSARYCDASVSLLTAFLEQNHLDARLARLVTPKHPRPVVTPDSLCVPASVAGADRQLAQLEADGKGMPVLLRQYLKLNARAIGFSVDPAFGDVIDALMAIDLTTVNPEILGRYFGAQGIATYRAHHESTDVQAVA